MAANPRNPVPGTRLFVTGTDTGVGKTCVAAGLLRALRRRGLVVRGLKPIASGAHRTAAGLRNDDALLLSAESSGDVPYETVNPWCFEPAIAPHLAAAEAGTELHVEAMLRWYERAASGCDVAVIEGAGGWRVPLHPDGFFSDFAEALGLPVVLVVGLRLGCLNHARLTWEAIGRSGRCRVAGWVGTGIDREFRRPDDNVRTLSRLLGSEPWAIIPWHAAPDVGIFAAALERAGVPDTLVASQVCLSRQSHRHSPVFPRSGPGG